MKYILAIDPGANLGWARHGLGGVVESGVEHLYGDLDVRLGNLLAWLDGYGPPDEVACERPFGNRALTMMEGVLRAWAARHGAKFFLYPPKQVKLAATGSGNSDKRAVRKVVEAHFKRKVAKDDESDALAVLLCHLHRSKTRERILEGKKGAR